MSDRSSETVVTGFAPTRPDDDLAPGTIVESFEIECTLGRGGMSTVYGAVHTVIGKRGAVKVLRRELCTDEQEVARFVQEARAVNQIGHANIVDVFAFGTLDDGRSYLIMEWLVGQSLRNRMRRGPLSRSEVRELVLDIVRALEATHAKGIIHRDLKPDNVFLVERPGERPRAKLLDFGVAKLTGEGRLDRTHANTMLGTPQYLAPEQARGEAVLASDIYTLGVVLFELAAGRPPFAGDSPLDVVALHLTEPPPRLASMATGVTPALDELVDAMLAKDPAQRPSLARIKAELEQLGRSHPEAMKTRTIRRSTRLALLIAALVGALAMVLVMFALIRRDEPAAEPAVTRARPQPAPSQPAPSQPAPSKPAPPPAPVEVAHLVGTLTIEWQGREQLAFTVDGDPVQANTPIELAPGPHRLGIQGKHRRETQDLTILAGQSLKVPIRPATRAPSREVPSSLDPLNNAPR